MSLISSKLPHVGTTIFTIMSKMAQDHDAINLSQGFPGFDCDPRLIRWVEEGMRKGMNQYPPMAGLPSLREEIGKLIMRAYQRDVDIDNEITVVTGATEGLMASLMALVHPGDEVIVFDPAYDAYRPAISLAGGKAVSIPLAPPSFTIDWDRVEDAITPKTKYIMLNYPHNPTGAILNGSDIVALKGILQRHNLIVLSDEVYEHMVYDGQQHLSMLRDDFLADRSVVFASFGKTLHVTGWKVGYVVANPALTQEIRKVHQFTTFTTSTPFQYGIAEYLKRCDDQVWGLGEFYQRKRDVFSEIMAGTPFHMLPCNGTYFQMASYKGISDLPDTEFANFLTQKIGVAAIPTSVFYEDGTDHKLIRFCFAKEEEELKAAGTRLQALGG
ncbi:MAG: methionine aminotransferase [Bacteroidota bacterium]